MSDAALIAIPLILAAAVLHATWNAMIKGAGDRMVTMGLINLGHGALGTVLVLLYGAPMRESWGFIVASTVIHFFYYGFLVLAYRLGDLSRVYPIARGVAPLLVAIGGFLFAAEVPTALTFWGLLLVCAGIGLLMLERGPSDRKAVLAALMTGFTIAAYSVVDGLGARASGNVLGYIGWLFVLECIAAFGFLWLRRGVLGGLSLGVWLTGLAGGLISAVAYGLAIYAKTLTGLATVSAVRESSVIIAALIGVIWFGERPWRLRLTAAVVVALGVVLLAAGA